MTRPATLDEANARLRRLDGGLRLDTERTPPSWTAYGVGRGDGETWEAAWDAMVARMEAVRGVLRGESPQPSDPALLAAANRALHAEVGALRRQVAELTENGVSVHKAAAAGMESERAAVVAWLRSREVHQWARLIERGAHR